MVSHGFDMGDGQKKNQVPAPPALMRTRPPGTLAGLGSSKTGTLHANPFRKTFCLRAPFFFMHASSQNTPRTLAAEATKAIKALRQHCKEHTRRRAPADRQDVKRETILQHRSVFLKRLAEHTYALRDGLAQHSRCRFKLWLPTWAQRRLGPRALLWAATLARSPPPRRSSLCAEQRGRACAQCVVVCVRAFLSDSLLSPVWVVVKE